MDLQIHDQIKELSKNCDVMIIIGSFTSANSKRLTELAKERIERHLSRFWKLIRSLNKNESIDFNWPSNTKSMRCFSR